MVTTSLIQYAEAEISRLGLGDSPTNCHGVVAHDVGGGKVRLSDGVGLDVIVTDADQLDTELEEMVKFYENA